jgi:hypothetical protein
MSADERPPVITAGQLIPGAFEARPARDRQAGGMGGPAAGSPDSPVGASSVSKETAGDRRKEGGGER